jgi:hypothetical protein
MLMLLVLISVVIHYVKQKMDKLWLAAKQKHRDEMLQLYLFVGSWYCATPVIVRRAYMPLFSIQLYNLVGLTFIGVQAIVYDKRGNVYYGTRDKERSKRWTNDIGIAGMMPYGHSVYETMNEELHEEFGLYSNNLPVKFLGVCTPYHGASCIIAVYKIVNVSTKKPKSKDGTYVKIGKLRKDCIIKDFENLPVHKDSVRTKKDTYVLHNTGYF